MKTLKVIFLSYVTIVTIVAFYLTFFAGQFYRIFLPQTNTQEYFHKQYIQALINKESELHLKSMTSFAWDKVCLFRTEVNREEILKMLGDDHLVAYVFLPIIYDLFLGKDTLFVFTKDDGDLRYALLDYNAGDLPDQKCFNNDAKLIFDPSSNMCNYVTGIENGR